VREPRARRSPLEGGGDPRARRNRSREREPSSEAELARGGREPSSEAELARGGREPSSEADLARGGALLGRSGGPRGPSRRGLCCVRMFCVMFVLCVFCRF
jgi:hypothetical protein